MFVKRFSISQLAIMTLSSTWTLTISDENENESYKLYKFEAWEAKTGTRACASLKLCVEVALSIGRSGIEGRIKVQFLSQSGKHFLKVRVRVRVDVREPAGWGVKSSIFGRNGLFLTIGGDARTNVDSRTCVVPLWNSVNMQFGRAFCISLIFEKYEFDVIPAIFRNFQQNKINFKGLHFEQFA